MKIGIVCPYDLGAEGGVQQLCVELAERLRHTGDEAILVGPGRRPGALSVGSVVSLRANRSVVPLTAEPAAFWKLRRALADVDVVHVHEPFIPLAGWAALRLGKPTVATFHADPPAWARRLYGLLTPLARPLLAHASLTAPSPVAASAVPAAWGAVEVIPNAIDVDSYRVDVPRDPRRVAFLGRDDPRKGLDVILRAWPQIRRRHPDAELIVMGATRSPVDGVDFRGRVSDQEKRQILGSSAVMVAPNLGGESFGIVIAEAMAAGCAVVASDLPAFRAVLGDSGRLVRVGDAVELEEAVSDLLADPATATRLGEAARDDARRFDWSRVTSMYRAVYESAVTRSATTIRGRKE